MKQSKKKSKRKKKTPAQLADDCAVLLQKLRRMELADHNGMVTCVSCNKRLHWKEAQGGHWIERGRAATKLVEEQINPQCVYCNQHGMRYKTIVRETYGEYMRDMYGHDFCKQLLEDSKKVHKWNRAELEDKMVELKKRIKEQEAKLECLRPTDEKNY